VSDDSAKIPSPFDVRTIRWKDAARELQPVRPVLPGVQFVLS